MQAIGTISVAERPRSRPQRPVKPRAATGLAPAAARMLLLQRQAGNAAVARLLNGGWSPSSAVVQREGDDIKIEMIVDRLQGAIKNDSSTNGDVHSSFVTIDVEKAAAALQGLTPAQGRAVEASWAMRDGRRLKDLIMGTAPGRGNYTYLEPGPRRRLMGLLAGTVYEQEGPPADPWNPEAERKIVENRALQVDVARLHDSLADRKAHDTAFEILGRWGGPPQSQQFVALNESYKRQWDTGLYVDFSRFLRGEEEERAEALLEGRTQTATGLELEILGEEKHYATATPKEQTYGQAIEDRIEQLRMEAGDDTAKLTELLKQTTPRGWTVDAAIRSGSTEATKKVLDALISGSDADVTAAKLARLESERRLQASDIERALVDLRTKAIMHVALDLVRNPPPTPLTDAQRQRRETNAVTTSFTALGSAYFALTRRGLEATVLFTGTEVERERNRELLKGMGTYLADDGQGAGQADPAKRKSAGFVELDLAVRSWNSARIKEFLSGRTRSEIDKLAAEHERHYNGYPLWTRIHLMLSLSYKGGGGLPAGSRVDTKELEEIIEIVKAGGVFTPRTTGDRLANLLEEGSWYWDRIGNLYDRTMDKRGLFAELRDWKGNQDHDLVELARKRAKQAYDALTAAARTKSMKTTAEAMDLVGDLKVSYNRLKYNVDVYNESTKAAFLAFVDLAVNLVGIALSFTTGTPVSMLLRNIVGTVGTKLVLLREDYSANDFIRDVVSQAGGALGSQVATSILAKGVGHLSQAARVAGLRLSPEIGALAGKGLEWAADQVGSTAGAKAAVGEGLSLPSLSEWADAAALTLAHKGKAAISKPKEHAGAGAKRASGHGAEAHPAPEPATSVLKHQPEPGVRRAAELPSGGQMKLLESGRVASCHSPCVVDDTAASLVQKRFERELSDRALDEARRALDDIRARERAAIDAGDHATRDRLFDEAAAISDRLEQFRLGQMSTRSGVPQAQLRELVLLAGDHAAGVQQLLHFARNDVNRVRDLLAYAERDPATVARLAELAGKIERHTPGGGRYEDPRLQPYATAANMEHFVAAHTFEHFADFEIRPQLTGFWPEGTKRAHVEEYLLQAVQKLKEQGFQAPPPPRWWDKAVMLDNGILVQVGFNGQMIGQFFPIDGPRVSHYAVDEVRLVGRVLFGRLPR